MKVIRNIENLPNIVAPIITMGTFDGVHKGHQQILEELNTLKKQLQGESIVLSFYPHPRKLIQGASVPLLNTLSEKIALLAQAEVDYLVLIPFNRHFADMSPENYVADFLVANFHPQCIVIGYDHRFGKNREGDIHLLKKLAPQYHFQVKEISAQTVAEISVSSTKIRRALLAGQIEKANDLLGYNYALTGTVVAGEQLGRTLGFPTANLDWEESEKLLPANGIYIAQADVMEKTYAALVNVGVRPTVSDSGQRSVEVYLLDFDGDLYGKQLRVHFLQRIRDEVKFDTIVDMQKQMLHDKEKAYAYFNKS
ncbi:MAG: bifunctional riboflavin kinase/FAD synthetase [Chitinophagales bacterium]|nr:bifunctional riboflavin kinase/FAD synthetase [Bacteroidota bacterium]MCB9043028.1 bifunctional riboflavin kinase/FAD synthetase [Chitinophagales bacterium]